ncbi:MAG: aquaporin [Rhodobacteraceae bacterium]|nr:aquaporin [Paracoccaceae bacterium]
MRGAAIQDLPRRLAAEALGTGLLVCTVAGSGIMAETLNQDVALALLGKTLPTRAIPVGLMTLFGPISGAHFNPHRHHSLRDAGRSARVCGRTLYRRTGHRQGAGSLLAHAVFELPILQASSTVRTGPAQRWD